MVVVPPRVITEDGRPVEPTPLTRRRVDLDQPIEYPFQERQLPPFTYAVLVGGVTAVLMLLGWLTCSKLDGLGEILTALGHAFF